MAKYGSPEQLDRTFAALADPTRRAVLERLRKVDEITVSEIAEPFSIQLPTVMKHLDVLERAGLIERTKRGRTVSVRARRDATKAALQWLSAHERFWTNSLDRLARLVEKR